MLDQLPKETVEEGSETFVASYKHDKPVEQITFTCIGRYTSLFTVVDPTQILPTASWWRHR